MKTKAFVVFPEDIWGWLLLSSCFGVGYLLDRQFFSVNEKLEEQRHEGKELRDRVDEIWQRILDIDHHTKQWNEHPRCELEQKLWLKEIGFTETVQAIADGPRPGAG